jgi:hypothetical protein
MFIIIHKYEHKCTDYSTCIKGCKRVAICSRDDITRVNLWNVVVLIKNWEKGQSNTCKAHVLSCLYCYYHQWRPTYWSFAQADSVPAVELARNGSTSLGIDGCGCWCTKTWPSPSDATLTASIESPSFMPLLGASTRGGRTVGDTAFKWSAVTSSPLHPESCNRKCSL